MPITDFCQGYQINWVFINIGYSNISHSYFSEGSFTQEAEPKQCIRFAIGLPMAYIT